MSTKIHNERLHFNANEIPRETEETSFSKISQICVYMYPELLNISMINSKICRFHFKL